MSKYSSKPNKDVNFNHLIEEIKNSLEAHFKAMLSKTFINADEEFFELADSARSNAAQNRYFELMRNLREMKQDLSDHFITDIQLLLCPFSEFKTGAEKNKTNNDGELSLVGQEEMEDMVLIKSISGDAAGKFREAISHLEARLEHLALKTPAIFAKKALDPINICQAFDSALSHNFKLDDKKLLFRLFNETVISKLDVIYDTTNNLLIDAGVLPQIKLHAKKSVDKKRPTQTPPDLQNNEPEDSENINQGGYAMTAAPGHGGGSSAGGQARGGYTGGGGSAGGQTEGGYTNGGSAGGQTEGGYTGGGSAGGQTEGGYTSGGSSADSENDSAAHNEATDTSNYHHQTAGMPAKQVSQTLGNYLGAPIQPGPTSEHENSEAYPASTPQFYGHRDILTALSGLQLQPAFNASGDLKFDGEAIKQAVLKEIAKSAGGVVTKRINSIAEKTIDFIELIFDAIIEDDDISDTIKTLLLRLQIPVIKASMVDQEFFIYDDHPARLLLDRIAEVGIGITEHTDEIYIQLEAIIVTLVNEFELQTSSFEKALDTLNAFVNERDEAARKKEEETQHQVLREHARSTVLKALRNVTRGKTLPESTHALILKRWPTLMYNHYLNNGKENDEWITIIEILRDIINSIQPLGSAADLEHLLNTKDKLIETVLEYLNRTNQSKKDIKKVIGGLKGAHQKLIDTENFEKGTPATEKISQQPEPIEEEEPPGPTLPSSIVPGMWYQIYMGEDKAQRRGKLSVIIIQDSKLVFVNYQGGIIVEKSFKDFIDEMEKGLSKGIMGHSVFDHALNRVVTGLNKK